MPAQEFTRCCQKGSSAPDLYVTPPSSATKESMSTQVSAGDSGGLPVSISPCGDGSKLETGQNVPKKNTEGPLFVKVN